MRLAFAVAVALLLFGLQLDREDRISGRLAPGSACRDGEGARFRLQTGGRQLEVRARRVPDAFGCDPEVRLVGTRHGRFFEAETVLVRCPSPYRPCVPVPSCT